MQLSLLWELSKLNANCSALRCQGTRSQQSWANGAFVVPQSPHNLLIGCFITHTFNPFQTFSSKNNTESFPNDRNVQCFQPTVVFTWQANHLTSNHPIPCARGCMWLRIISIGKIQRNWLNHVPKCHTIAHEKRCLLTRVTIWQHGVSPNGANEEKHRGESFQDQCPIGKKSEVERAKDLAGWIHISVALAHG